MTLNPINLAVLQKAEPGIYDLLISKIRKVIALRNGRPAPKGNRFAAHKISRQV